MRSLFVLPFIITLAISCSSDNENDPGQCPEKWQLVKMTGNVATLPPATGSDMDWQEWYQFYSDQTFSKTRERDNTVIEATGTYALVTLPGGDFMELTFETGTDLVGNCYPDPKELLWIKSKDELAGTWATCDGPGLTYVRVENNCNE